jgi:hypothetical protein
VSGAEPRRGVVVGAAAGTRDGAQRLLSLAATIRRGTLKLALVGAAAAAVIVVYLLRDGFPDDAGAGLLTVVGIALALAPPLLLGSLWFVLGHLLLLPERLRAIPGGGLEQGDALRRLVAETRSRRGPGAIAVPLWRLARVATTSRELLTPYAPLLPLASPWYLAAVAASGFAVCVEVVVALVLVLSAALG